MNKKPIFIEISEKHKQLLENLCTKKHKTTNNMIKTIIKEYITAKRQKTTTNKEQRA